MVIEIRTTPEGHSALSQETDLGILKDDLPCRCGKITCRAEIDRTGPVLYVHLRFHCTCELECSRCLEPFSFPVEGDVRVVVREQGGRHGAVVDDEHVDFFYDNRNPAVDLSPAIYEEIMVAFPLKPLCSESCKGIGMYKDSAVVRNAGEKKEVDPRWAALKRLIQ